MQRSLGYRKIIGFVVFILVFFFSITFAVRAEEPISLLDIRKQEDPYHTRLTFSFSGLPKFTMERSGQRIDLFFDQVTPAVGLRRLPEDETVVKILLAEKQRRLLTSILLRRPPQHDVTATQKQPNQVVLDIYWEDEAGSRPGVAFRIADLPPKKAGRRAARFQRQSPWMGQWWNFFRAYRDDWQLQLPLCYTLPQLPPLIDDRRSPLRATAGACGQGPVPQPVAGRERPFGTGRATELSARPDGGRGPITQRRYRGRQRPSRCPVPQRGVRIFSWSNI